MTSWVWFLGGWEINCFIRQNGLDGCRDKKAAPARLEKSASSLSVSVEVGSAVRWWKPAAKPSYATGDPDEWEAHFVELHGHFQTCLVAAVKACHNV
jgi:hypothetical protein